MKKNDTIFRINKLNFFNKLELESKDRYPRYRKLVYALINKTFVQLKTKNGGELIGVVISASYWKPKESYFEVELSRMIMTFIQKMLQFKK